MKYMIVVPSFSNGGAERVVSVLASQLARRGEKIVVVLYWREENEYPVDGRVPVRCISRGTEAEYRSMTYAQKVRALRRVLREERPDVLVPFLYHVGRLAFIASIGLRVKLIQTIRIDPQSDPATKGQRRLRDALIRLSWRTIVQCEAQKRYFSSRTQKKVHVLLNPVSENFLKAEYAWPRQAFQITTAGRLTPQKNFPLLNRAVHRLHQSYPEIRLAIYGTGPLAEALQAQITALGEAARIQLMGRSGHMEQIYMQSNAFVLCSSFEGLPNALMEAMAVGLPCVATDCRTGPSELIRNGETGLLIPTDDEAALAGALERIYTDETLARKMGKQARDFIRGSCNEGRVAERFLEICGG